MDSAMTIMEPAPRGRLKERGGARGGGCERGAALVLALFLITILTVLGVLVLNTSIVETKMANNQKISSQAFYASEAGLERALLKVMNDFATDGSTGKPWGNNRFAGADTVAVTVRASGSPAWSISARTLDMWLSSPGVQAWSFTGPGGRGGNAVGRATYRIYSWAPDANEIYLLSYATQPDAVAAVEYHLKVEDLSPYMNAIFMGGGLSGTVQGNVNIHGSIYSNGPLAFTGNVGIGNNYTNDVGSGPALGAQIFNYPSGDDLEAKVRVRGGDLDLGGSAQVGASGAGPPKHSVAGVYVDGDIPASGVYADEITHQVPNIPMPSVLDGLKNEYGATFIDTNFPGTSDTIRARLAYTALINGTGVFAGTPPEVTSSGYVIKRSLTFSSSGPDSFSSLDALGNGMIWNKAAGTLQIIGNVLVKGTLTIDRAVTYTSMGAYLGPSGTGVPPPNQSELGAMIYVTGDVTLKNSFTPPSGSGYLNGGAQTNSLGVATPGNLTFAGTGGSKIATGFYFTSGQTTFSKQWKVMGTMITGTAKFDQVPDIFQVPALKDYLPHGMPGGQQVLNFTGREWRRVY